jgi:hypothetical protein
MLECRGTSVLPIRQTNLWRIIIFALGKGAAVSGENVCYLLVQLRLAGWVGTPEGFGAISSERVGVTVPERCDNRTGTVETTEVIRGAEVPFH